MAPRLEYEFVSLLPADDTHPYRTGAWRPQHREWTDLEPVVEGELPAGLNGVYLRNSENPLVPNRERYHPFDGDGMIHSISFREGHVEYRNRFVRTKGLAALPPIAAHDSDARACEIAASCARRAGLAGVVTVERRDLGDLEPPSGASGGLVATNPPFAGRAPAEGFEVARLLRVPERDVLFLERSRT